MGFIQAQNTSSALLETIFWVEITQLLLVYLHFMLPKEYLFGSFCHHSIMSFLLGRASCKPPAEAAGSRISPWCSQLGLRGQHSFHSNPWSCENYLRILFVRHFSPYMSTSLYSRYVFFTCVIDWLASFSQWYIKVVQNVVGCKIWWNYSVPEFPHLQNGESYNTHLSGLHWAVTELMYPLSTVP